MPNRDEYLNVRQVATMHHVHVTSVTKALRSGRLRGVKYGPFWLVRKSEAIAWQPRRYRPR